MDERKRRVLIRMIISLTVFIYISYLAWKSLPRFDFGVIVAFFALYISWSVIETIMYKAPETLAVDDDDRRSYIYLQLSSLLTLFFALFDFLEFHLTRISSLEPGIVYVGFILFLLYTIIRYQALVSLGKYYNPRVALYEEHTLITSGVYQYLRHPFYLTALLISLAVSLLFNSWGALLLFLFTVIPAILYRIRVEEEFLLKHFGNRYKEYMEKTKALIPGLW
ncbi:MAG: isoprenylcysteine carboxylmethyltransferase family protein [Syntrophomonas sp.]